MAEYVYDGAKRRAIKKTYSAGVLDETRHFYYTEPQKWQVIDERLESSSAISANPERQFVWGIRYLDDLVLRDRDTDSNGSLDEQLYALQDGNWNVTALADTSGTVQERYAYSAYGIPRVLAPTFTSRASTSCNMEVLYMGYRFDAEGGLQQVRNRILHAGLGCWIQRDPVGYVDSPNLYLSFAGNPIVRNDATGLTTLEDCLAKCQSAYRRDHNRAKLYKCRGGCRYPVPSSLRFRQADGCCRPLSVGIVVAEANRMLATQECFAWFVDHGLRSYGGRSVVSPVRCHGAWKPPCWGFPAFSHPLAGAVRAVGLCENWLDALSTHTFASLLVHELAHYFCTVGPGREDCAISAQVACG